MCGRFTLTLDPGELKEAFPDLQFPNDFSPRYNIAPSQPVAVVSNAEPNRVNFFTWGLIPSWAKDPAIGNRLVNARAETLGEKPSFRSAYKYRRCLILADGFFEWKAQPGTKSKIPHFIRLKSGRPFAFAGLWERWQAGDGSEIHTAAIITTHPNPFMAAIHDRMPVILPPDAYPLWLDPSPQAPASLQSLLVPYPADAMEAYPVSPLVNSPGNDRPELLIQE